MKYQKYDKYKDSGLNWLGNMPLHWNVILLKRISKITYGIGGEIDRTIIDGTPTISLPNVKIDGTLDVTNEEVPQAYIEKHERKDVLLKKGDLLFNWRNGSVEHLGKTAYFNQDKEYSHVSFLLKIRFESTEFHSKYFYYLINGYRISGFFKHAKAGVNNTYNLSELSKLPVIIPTGLEQQSIANFLDRETARIDALIDKKQKLIDLLKEKRTALITKAVTKGLNPDVKMKDSGIEWLGEVPEHWDNWKLAHGYGLIGSGTTPKSDSYNYYDDGETAWVTTSELRESIILETKNKLTQTALSDYSTLKKYPKGTLLIAMYGATIGRLGILGIPATVNQACCAFSKSKVFDKFFVYYWFWMARPILISLSSGGGQPNLNQDMLKKIIVPVPDINEQRQIVEYLNIETKKIDNLISKTEQSITKQKEYRTALISAAVTGKIKVSG